MLDSAMARLKAFDEQRAIDAAVDCFWARGYAEVRKQLRGRYPRHSWPDDPTTAEPTSRVRRRS